MKCISYPGCRLGIVLSLAGLALAGCELTPRIQPIAAWQASGPAPASIESPATTPEGERATVRLTCDARATSRQPLSLSVATGGAEDADQPTQGRIVFGDESSVATTWEVDGEQAVSTVPTDRLAEGLARMFRSHERVTLENVPGHAAPLRFTVGQGPYESVGGDFFAQCPATAARMPQLVRIRRARLVPAEKGDLSVSEEMRSKSLPVETIQVGHYGTVEMVAVVDAEGDVFWPEIIHSSGYSDLDRVALSSFGDWQFELLKPIGPDTLYVVGQTLKLSEIDRRGKHTRPPAG